jgi:hypothetical protein
VLVSDSNQRIDLVNYYDSFEVISWNTLRAAGLFNNLKLVIFDIEQGIVYRTEGFGGGTIEWISENTILLN